MALLSQRAALAAAVTVLRDLHDPRPCEAAENGACGAHDWRGGEGPCPQLRLRLLITEMETTPTPPYTRPALLALLRGATEHQEVHVRIQIGDHVHRGVLGHTEPEPGVMTDPFHVDLIHGQRVDQLPAESILEADVCGRSLGGVPIDPTHDPK